MSGARTQKAIYRYVLTGGPSIGKTTTLEMLAARGYAIVPEAARMVIEEQELLGSDVLPWRDAKKFQHRVAEEQLKLEASCTAPEAFLDRSLIDGYAYSLYAKVDPPLEIEEHARDRYDKVFLLAPLPHYINDELRRETKEFRETIHPMIEVAYKKFGYEPIYVPVLLPEARAEFIVSLLR